MAGIPLTKPHATKKGLKVAVMGAGAVGCYFGGKLARAGHEVVLIAAGVPSQYSSTAQDLAHGKRSEIDYRNGLIVQRGAALGIATPANRMLWALVKLMEGSGCRATAGLRYGRTRIRELSVWLLCAHGHSSAKALCPEADARAAHRLPHRDPYEPQ